MGGRDRSQRNLRIIFHRHLTLYFYPESLFIFQFSQIMNNNNQTHPTETTNISPIFSYPPPPINAIPTAPSPVAALYQSYMQAAALYAFQQQQQQQQYQQQQHQQQFFQQMFSVPAVNVPQGRRSENYSKRSTSGD